MALHIDFIKVGLPKRAKWENTAGRRTSVPFWVQTEIRPQTVTCQIINLVPDLTQNYANFRLIYWGMLF